MTETRLPAKPDKDKWAAMDFISQMANIGSEVGRTLKWKQKGNTTMARNAFIRTLDLFDLTIETGRDNASSTSRDSMLREVLIARDQFCEEYLSEDSNAIAPSDKYFSQFAKACAFRSKR